MSPAYRVATASDPGECLNVLPLKSGGFKCVEPTKNAVIVQLCESYTHEGEREVKRLVSIECVDEELYPELKEEALRILRYGD